MESLEHLLKNRPRNPGTPTPKPGASPQPDEETAEAEVCQNCGGFGVYTFDIPVGHPQFGRAQPCECTRERREREHKERLLRYCEFPPIATGMTLEAFRVTPATREAFDAATALSTRGEDGPFMLTLGGPPGVGKTHLAVGIAWCYLKRREPAQYLYVPDMLASLRAGFGDEADGFDARFKRLCDVSLLVLDDLGAEKQTEWAEEQLDRIVDHRYRHQRAIVVTTNLAPAGMSARIASRLRDTLWGRIVGIKAPDYRLTRGSR